MTAKLGFIGGGAMAGAMVESLAKAGLFKGNIFVSDHKAARCAELKEKFGVTATVGADSFIGEVDALVLAVKPQAAKKALAEIAGSLKEGALVISIVAGLTLSVLKEALGDVPIVRVMPNTPLAVGAGMSAFTVNDKVSAEQKALTEKILQAGGEAAAVTEAQMDAVTGLSGSGPAYGFLTIAALADGGVLAGLKRDAAIKLAAQTMLGAAKMVLETGKHPAVLQDMVESPAGTTIEGVRVLEKAGVRSAMIEAVLAAAKRSAELGK